jgi:hypothetical protein
MTAASRGFDRVSLGSAETNRRQGAMARPTTDELKVIAREAFGRELSDEEAEAYRGRLPTMVQNVRRLRDWAPRLRAVEPALVQRLIGGGSDA